MEGVMQVWLAAEVQLLSVSGFLSDIPIAANPLHRGLLCMTFDSPLLTRRKTVLRATSDAGSLREPFGLLPIPGRR
jgi:hypothetical protein